LRIDLKSALLSMKVRAIEALVEPGQDATFEVEVSRDGKPKSGAEVALIVVDEAVLALSGHGFRHPILAFMSAVHHGTQHYTSLHNVYNAGADLDGDPGISRYRTTGLVRGTGTGGGGTGEGTIGMGAFGTVGRGATTVTARKDFRANAAFSPLLKTDSDGRVRLTVKMPESLTRFRIVALATADTHLFGQAEDTIVTQRKLNARAVAPRFLSQGDTFSLPVMVQNLDARPRTVDVAVRAANLAGSGPAGKRVSIPGGQRAEVRFDFATQARGRAVVQTIALSGDFVDASQVEIPVYVPATTESLASYGTVDQGASFERFVVPESIFPDVGGVEVSLSSTQLQSLTDAYVYLQSYPFECAEQRSSRMLATAAVYDILDAFSAPDRPSRREIEETRNRDVRTLVKAQRPDGGWGFFDGMKSDPFVSMQVVQALAASAGKGKAGKKAVSFVDHEVRAAVAKLGTKGAHAPSRQDAAYMVSLAATGLAALAADGEDVRARAERLHQLAARLNVYPMDAKARLLALVAKQEAYRNMRSQVLREIVSAIHETASSATVATSYVESEQLLLVSANRTNALVLDALLREEPAHPLVAKLARGVLDGRRQGRWRTTQENLMALQALRRYFDTFEKNAPNFKGRLWFGSAAYAEQNFVGRSNTSSLFNLDWTTLVPGSAHDVALVKEGTGRMYYRVGISYASKQTKLAALDAGFVVRRSYVAADNPGDVKKLDNGHWRIRLGAKVVVTVEVTSTTKRFGVAVVDPMPAGFESVNEVLATAERVVRADDDSIWDHQNLRDQRSEAFLMSMGEGSHRLRYTVRATTPGVFLAAPAKAEEMYSPETFGRSSGEVVEVASDYSLTKS
jgi:uncharacterized protein YfaS (alpha-2-macroglobulin family)